MTYRAMAHRLTFLLAALFPLAMTASAAGIDCARARSPSENAICMDASLQALDARLARRFAKAMRLQTAQRPLIAAAQKQWLARRESCAGDVQCLSQGHQQRIAELEAGLRAFLAYKPDAVDMAALNDLRLAVEAWRKTRPDVPLERALAALAIEKEATAFSNEPDAKEYGMRSRFPKRRPAGVSKDEWDALKRSEVDGGGENGNASYLLIDLDGDGQRDLVVDSYVGGTGLFNWVSVLQRRHGRFMEHQASASTSDQDASPDASTSLLYSLNGRGSNQSAHWVRLRGRVYAAYTDSAYGVDHAYLLRPLQINDQVPMLTLHYRYRLSVPRLQESGNGGAGRTVLSLETQAVWQNALKALENPLALKRDDGEVPLCPRPEGIPADAADSSQGFGPSHYSVEIVGDFTAWFDQKDCRLGRLINRFGAYTEKDGLSAMLLVKKPGDEDYETFTVVGRRRVVKVHSGLASFPSN